MYIYNNIKKDIYENILYIYVIYINTNKNKSSSGQTKTQSVILNNKENIFLLHPLAKKLPI